VRALLMLAVVLFAYVTMMAYARTFSDAGSGSSVENGLRGGVAEAHVEQKLASSLPSGSQTQVYNASLANPPTISATKYRQHVSPPLSPSIDQPCRVSAVLLLYFDRSHLLPLPPPPSLSPSSPKPRLLLPTNPPTRPPTRPIVVKQPGIVSRSSSVHVTCDVRSLSLSPLPSLSILFP
jgi:hypothetical protein